MLGGTHLDICQQLERFFKKIFLITSLVDSLIIIPLRNWGSWCPVCAPAKTANLRVVF